MTCISGGASFSPQPVVCAAGEQYVICVPTSVPALLRVDVGGEAFFCDDNGVRVTHALMQHFTVPMRLLDEAGAYTVSFARAGKREPYHPQHGEERRVRFAFRPVPGTRPVRVALLSDVHGRGEEAVLAARFFDGAPDLLILGGDISSSSMNERDVMLPFSIAFSLTKGETPVILCRGNHDLRGTLAPRLSELYPTDEGRMYYTVRFAGFDVLVLDCGEDKNDGHSEYGGTAAFHPYRLRQTAFLRALAEDRSLASDGKTHIVLSHIPFPHLDGDKQFAIEADVYREWCACINRFFAPQLALFGHVHHSAVYERGDPYNTFDLHCPIVVGGVPAEKNYTGVFITLRQGGAEICFSDANQKNQGTHTVAF